MTGSKRAAIRIALIALQWVSLTVALGALVMRSDASFERLITPHLGATPMFIGAFGFALLLGLTIENLRYMAPLVILMCVVSASFIGVLTYAPVVDGVIIRTTALDNFVIQRTLIVTILLALGAVPGAAVGNLLGAFLDIHQEILPPHDKIAESAERPWWERRRSNAQPRSEPGELDNSAVDRPR